MAKISGPHRPGPPLTTDALRRVLDIALDAFGPDRLMYGGDPSVSELSGGCASQLQVTEALIGTLSDDEQGWIFRRTATRVHSWREERHERQAARGRKRKMS